MELSGKPELVEYIKSLINQKGAISFEEFMTIALYHPDYGYYTSQKPKIGGFGDYFTASELDPIFGQLLAKQFVEIYHQFYSGSDIDVVEIGSGKGYLLHDVVRTIKEQHPDVFLNINFFSVEKSSYHRQLQTEVLKEFKNIHFLEDVSSLPQIQGIIYANELFDAIPTHMVRKREGKIWEVYITVEKGQVVEVEKTPSEEVLSYIDELKIDIPEGMTTEINTGAAELIQEIGKKLDGGFVFTVDYGYPSAELYKPYRNRGTIICYYRHTYNENYYQNVGMQDITSHVNFSALAHYGKKAGLEVVGFTDQAHFLINLGLAEELNRLYENGDYRSYERANRLKTLVLPKGMGEKFKVLVQSKNITNPKLTGLKLLPPQTDRYKL